MLKELRSILSLNPSVLLLLTLTLSLATTMLVTPENFFASARTPLYDVKSAECDENGQNCKPVFWEITVKSPELVNAKTGKMIWNYTPGLAAEYVVDIVIHPDYNLSSGVQYILQINSVNSSSSGKISANGSSTNIISSENGVTYQILSHEVNLEGTMERNHAKVRIPLQINHTGTYHLQLFFLANSTGSGVPYQLSYPETKAIPVNGCMCDFAGAFPEDYLRAYPLQRTRVVTVFFYDFEDKELVEQVGEGYVGFPLLLYSRIINNADKSQDYLYVVELVNEDTGKLEQTLTFDGTLTSRENINLNKTITFDTEGYYMVKAQIFDASSIANDGSSQQPISEQYVEHIDIEPASARMIE